MTAHDLARSLPGIAELRDHCRALAMAEAIVNPAADDRYYDFRPTWDDGEEAALMDNGSGDEYAVVFSAAGAFIRGFDHESRMSPYRTGPGGGLAPWPGVVDMVPAVFRPYVDEPAFGDGDGTPLVTVCVWRTHDDETWQVGTIDYPADTPGDPDGAAFLFALLLDRTPEAFKEFADDYYEVDLHLAALRHVFAQRPLTDEIVRTLNPDASLADLAEDITAIGWVQ